MHPPSNGLPVALANALLQRGTGRRSEGHTAQTPLRPPSVRFVILAERSNPREC
eukprot:m.14258 g.14258  ORF g.14258 m.14258 type:complete len:54 (+) comp25647_c0_seq5:245-406(+)